MGAEAWALEEWDELREAVRDNALICVESECLDLAAVLIRLAGDLRDGGSIERRSAK